MKSKRLAIELAPYLMPAFDTAWDIVDSKLGIATPSWELFRMGWLGFAYRVCAMEQYAQAHCELPLPGKGNPDQNIQEDQVVFDFLSNACSAANNLVYAAFSLGTHAAPIAFPINTKSDLRGVDRLNVADGFATQWPAEPISGVLGRLRDDVYVDRLFEMRDVVTHRGWLPRTHTVTINNPGERDVRVPAKIKDLPGEWKPDFFLDSRAVLDWQNALKAIFKDAPTAVEAFAQRL